MSQFLTTTMNKYEMLPLTSSVILLILNELSFCDRLKPLDIQFMKQLHNKVNIVPVLAKADTLTKQEVAKLKRKVSVIANVLSTHLKRQNWYISTCQSSLEETNTKQKEVVENVGKGFCLSVDYNLTIRMFFILYWGEENTESCSWFLGRERWRKHHILCTLYLNHVSDIQKLTEISQQT